MTRAASCFLLPRNKTIASIHIKVLQERKREREIKGLKKD